MAVTVYKDLALPQQNSLFTNAFEGYDHRERIADGAFYDMENLTGADYPLLCPRKPRGKVAALGQPLGLIAKDALAWVDGHDLYYNGYKVQGVELSTEENMLPKQLISMGAYLCIWPDKIYVNTADLTDYGSMAEKYTTVAGGTVRYAMCRMDGTEYDETEIVTSNQAPQSPENGTLWLDTSGDSHVLKRYNAATEEWVQVPTCYIKISATGIGHNFAEYDGVRLSGCTTLEAGETAETDTEKLLEKQVQALNTDLILYAAAEDYIVTVGFLDQAVEVTGQITVERRVPDCDYITESNNRLWGCKYGMVNGEAVNELYACKLGDFKNWNVFMGLSTDSYAVSVGTDGKWTGAATIAGGPVFFKENVLHKVSGSYPFSVKATACRGVEEGSWASLAIVGETLYYKSRTEVMAYQGALPVSVSEALGNAVYHNAVAGAYGDKLYLSMQGTDEKWSLFVYDTKRGMWHREDATHALGFAARENDLYYLDAGTKALMSVNGTEGTLEEDIRWSATTGVYGYDLEEQKYLRRFNLRLSLNAGSTCKLEIEYDSDGKWHDEGFMRGKTAAPQTFCVPVIPRRCDHCRIRLSGQGPMKLYSIGRVLETGSVVANEIYR